MMIYLFVRNVRYFPHWGYPGKESSEWVTYCKVESKVTSEVRTQNGITILSLFRVNSLHTTIKAKYKEIQIQT